MSEACLGSGPAKRRAKEGPLGRHAKKGDHISQAAISLTGFVSGRWEIWERTLFLGGNMKVSERKGASDHSERIGGQAAGVESQLDKKERSEGEYRGPQTTITKDERYIVGASFGFVVLWWAPDS